MILVNQDNKVYIVSPHHKTGGPRSLHQLGNMLSRYGIDTYIVYYSEGKSEVGKKLLYSDYNLKVAETVEDKAGNVVIVSEIDTGILAEFQEVKKVVWWLSLDFYFTGNILGAARQALRLKKRSVLLLPLMAIHMMRKTPSLRKHKKVLKKSELKKVYNLYNCEYVHMYLQKIGILEEKMHYLCGPLEEQYLSINRKFNLDEKEDLVVFNPAKTDKIFLQQIKDAMREINFQVEFIPIEKMSRDEVYHMLKKAKVYIDFGYFPGPERMPREAVSLYCNIITSKRGSAANDYDVPIPNIYKFDITKNNAKPVAKLIRDMIVNYQDYLLNGDVYRDKVNEQILRFDNDIVEIFRRGNFKNEA